MTDISQLLGRTLLLVAHPDDETVGCGALLQRMAEPIVVFATDGAPNDPYFWTKYGSRLQYQRVREEEARQALSIISVSEVHFLGNEPLAKGDCLIDQTLHRHLAEAYDRVAPLISRYQPDAMLTLAYEGGHPDHDCCSMLAARAGAQGNLPVWEFPLYHRSATGEMVYQNFSGEAIDRHGLQISDEEGANKRSMLNAYRSQHPFLLEFDLSIERFRPQPIYHYSQPPNSGVLNYEAWGWPIKGKDVCNSYCRFAEIRVGVFH